MNIYVDFDDCLCETARSFSQMAADLYCLDKYGRDVFYKDSVFALKLEDYYNMKFDYAIEDSPSAFRFFGHLPKLNVMVFDRPWNRECQLPGENYRRFADWESIRTQIMQ